MKNLKVCWAVVMSVVMLRLLPQRQNAVWAADAMLKCSRNGYV